MKPYFWGLMAAAFLIRALFVFWLAPAVGLYDAQPVDSDGYVVTAQDIHAGDYFFKETVISTRRMPLYPSLIALIALIPLPLQPMLQVWHILMDCGIVLGIYWFAKRYWGAWAALFGAGFYAFYPLALYRLSLMNTEVIQTLCLVLFVIGAARYLETHSVKDALLVSGISIGILNINPAFVLFPGLLALALLFRVPFSRAVLLGACIVVPISVFTLGWGARNYAITGEYFLFDTRGGKEFWIGNNQRIDGRWEGPDREIWERELEEHMRIMTERNLKTSDYNAYFYGVAFQEMKSNPAGAILLMGKKLVRFWMIPASERMTSITIPMQSFYLLLAAAGCFLYRRLHRSTVLPASLIAYFCAIYSLSYACIRFSHLVMPWVCAFAGLGLLLILHRNLGRFDEPTRTD